jgi:pimeloyl-ACP methyl ester carboxylesterase
MFALASKWLGDQWTVGDWAGMQSAAPRELPGHVLAALQQMQIGAASAEAAGGPPQNMKEYDPEWGRAFWTGTAGVGCDHERMLAGARAPFLLTHHYREIDPDTGGLMGAVSDEQVTRAGKLVTGAGQAFEVVDFPTMAHSMHAQDPERFTRTLRDWAAKLPASAEENR